jgi:hypothetical protein
MQKTDCVVKLGVAEYQPRETGRDRNGEEGEKAGSTASMEQRR